MNESIANTNNTVTMTSHNTLSLSDFAATFGSTVEQLWGAALHQATVDGILTLITMFFFTAMLIVWTRLVLKNTAPDGVWDTEFDGTVLKVITFVVDAGFVLWIFTTLPLLYASFFNPDFWVLKHFFSVTH